MKTTLIAASLLSALPYVAAHGYLRQVAIAGKIYRGNIPNVSNFPSPIRAINDITPVKGATNRAINCGKNAKIAELVADANPGDELTFDWAGGDNGLVSDLSISAMGTFQLTDTDNFSVAS